MYVLNTFLRFVRFLSNSIIGLGVGFILGILFSQGNLSDYIQQMIWPK